MTNFKTKSQLTEHIIQIVANPSAPIPPLFSNLIIWLSSLTPDDYLLEISGNDIFTLLKKSHPALYAFIITVLDINVPIRFRPICALAAQYGQIDILRYAVSIGCTMDESVCIAAIQSSELTGIDCLRFAHESGIFWRRNLGQFAATHNSSANGYACSQYLQSFCKA
jgi:hypothetical protein